MSDQQINYMKQLTQIYENRLCLWWKSPGGLKQVARIGSVPDEPGLVAFLWNERIGSNYVALDNCTTDDFTVTTTNIAVWPE